MSLPVILEYLCTLVGVLAPEMSLEIIQSAEPIAPAGRAKFTALKGTEVSITMNCVPSLTMAIEIPSLSASFLAAVTPVWWIVRLVMAVEI